MQGAADRRGSEGWVGRADFGMGSHMDRRRPVAARFVDARIEAAEEILSAEGAFGSLQERVEAGLVGGRTHAAEGELDRGAAVRTDDVLHMGARRTHEIGRLGGGVGDVEAHRADRVL